MTIIRGLHAKLKGDVLQRITTGWKLRMMTSVVQPFAIPSGLVEFVLLCDSGTAKILENQENSNKLAFTREMDECQKIKQSLMIKTNVLLSIPSKALARM